AEIVCHQSQAEEVPACYQTPIRSKNMAMNVFIIWRGVNSYFTLEKEIQNHIHITDPGFHGHALAGSGAGSR
ncbi:MAG TPA: hypothetical protein P5273_10470, partial [Syntrophomonadaceae bacterium]|nr:hypothetical protein [Syntrophomonadaceae bacterium]